VLRELGATHWKAGAAADAHAKWQKALRYLDVHAVMRAGAPAEFADDFAALRAPLLLNSALAALKVPGGTAGAHSALEATNSVLRLPNLSDSDRGTCCSSSAPNACEVAYSGEL
jgi:peptidyl-prolyl isomerase D